MRLLMLFLLVSQITVGQTYFKDHFGGTIGVVANFGTHYNSIGLNIKGYYSDYFYQFNAGTTLYLHHNHYGNRKRFIENRNSLGLILLGGKRGTIRDFQLDGLNHQTNYNLGLGFNYVWYYDNAGTSQVSGGWGVHIRELALYHENDLFGGQGKDRYRTGHFHVAFRTEDFKYGFGANMWTGESKSTYWDTTSFKGCPSGFRSLEDAPYGKTSHGIAYGSIVYNAPYGQDAFIKIGIDSEQVRHFFQNRLIHDIGRFVSRTTPHYPRLDEHGCPVFEKEYIRKSTLFYEMGINGNWSD